MKSQLWQQTIRAFCIVLFFGLSLGACSGPGISIAEEHDFYISFNDNGRRILFDQTADATVTYSGTSVANPFQLSLNAGRSGGIAAQSIQFLSVGKTDSQWQRRDFTCILIDNSGYWSAQVYLEVYDDGSVSGVFEAAFNIIEVFDTDEEAEEEGAPPPAEGTPRLLTDGEIRLHITRGDIPPPISSAGSSVSVSSTPASISSAASVSVASSAGSSVSVGNSSAVSAAVSSVSVASSADSSVSVASSSVSSVSVVSSSVSSVSVASSASITDVIGDGYSVTAPLPLSRHNRNESLRIGSFNIQQFGSTKLGRTYVLKLLASVATNYDVMAVQEVGSNGNPSDSGATTVMNGYIARINSLVQESGLQSELGTYAYVREHQFAFVYRTDIVTCDAAKPYTSFGTNTFTYSPLTAKFTTKVGNFSFALITVHTSPSSKANNTAEVMSLPAVLTEMRAHYGTDKVGALGDFNADGTYYSPGTAAQGWLAGFDPGTWFTIIPNGTKTTVAAANKYTYDRIQLSHPFAYHNTGRWGVVRFAEYYDVTQCEGAATDAGKEDALSDHYSVWAEFTMNSRVF